MGKKNIKKPVNAVTAEEKTRFPAWLVWNVFIFCLAKSCSAKKKTL